MQIDERLRTPQKKKNKKVHCDDDDRAHADGRLLARFFLFVCLFALRFKSSGGVRIFRQHARARTTATMRCASSCTIRRVHSNRGCGRATHNFARRVLRACTFASSQPGGGDCGVRARGARARRAIAIVVVARFGGARARSLASESESDENDECRVVQPSSSTATLTTRNKQNNNNKKVFKRLSGWLHHRRTFERRQTRAIGDCGRTLRARVRVAGCPRTFLL